MTLMLLACGAHGGNPGRCVEYREQYLRCWFASEGDPQMSSMYDPDEFGCSDDGQSAHDCWIDALAAHDCADSGDVAVMLEEVNACSVPE